MVTDDFKIDLYCITDNTKRRCVNYPVWQNMLCSQILLTQFCVEPGVVQVKSIFVQSKVVREGVKHSR